MTRTSADALAGLARAALTTALDGLDVPHEASAGPGADFIARVDDRVIAIDIMATAYATPERVRTMIGGHPSGQSIPLLVADHITESARRELADAGWSWLDRRGHIYMRAPGTMIDRDIEPVPRPGVPAAASPIAGASGIAVAYSILTQPEAAQPVRSIAPALGFSPASISTAHSALRDAGLLERDGRSNAPELFWALADVWRADAVWLANRPDPDDARAHARDLSVAGWCLSGTAAAVEWGAPVVTIDPLLDLYLPDPVTFTIARREYLSVRTGEQATASIAIAPAPWVTSRRLPARRGGQWPLAHPLAVALDLAQDRARGREILEDWTPPSEFARVW